MGTSEVIEFNYTVVEECLTEYQAVKARVEEKVNQLTSLISSQGDSWTGADAEYASALLADAEKKVEVIDYNIATCKGILGNASTNFKANEIKNASMMNNAYFG